MAKQNNTPSPKSQPQKPVVPVEPVKVERSDYIEPAAVITAGYQNNNSNKQELYLSNKLYVVNAGEVFDVPLSVEAEFLRIKVGMWFKVR